MTRHLSLFAFVIATIFATPLRAEEWIGAALADWGYRATTGAAEGYVPDALCAECHADKAESFAEVGMGKSFYRPSPQKIIERFDDAPYFHAPSQRYFQMSWADGAYVFRRWKQAPDGSETDVFETTVEWILGSGHHSRVYLAQSPNGTLVQLPLAWYTQNGGFWNMAPGYEFADHPGVTRVVPMACMGCHNAFPEVPEGSDRIGMPDIYPADLPEGIGCQRCHGPGARHAALAISGTASANDLQSAIVQPGKLPRDRLYSICYGCHMQPSVAINSPFLPGRGAYSFRPGERLEDFRSIIDVTDARLPKPERFDINHHPYRMEQSACFTETQDRGDGQLGCLTCHDPHVKIKPEARADHYRKACLSCHELDSSGQPVMADAAEHPTISDTEDCTLCHMPARRTQDVIHVTMTDHKITRDPGDLSGLVAPISKIPPNLTEVFPMHRGALPDQMELVQTLRALLSHSGPPPEWATQQLGNTLHAAGINEPGPWIEISRQLLAQNKPADARLAASRALAAEPDNPGAHMSVAIADMRLGNLSDAIERLRTAADTWPHDVAIIYNLGVALRASGDLDAALAAARQAAYLHPVHWPSHRLTGDIAAQKNDIEGAINAYQRALSIEPSAPRIREPLVALLKRAGRLEEAERYQQP